MELSEKIKRLRIKNNYKQEELAEVCNVTRSAVSNWETGRRIPDWDNIVTIAKLFNVTVEDLASSKKLCKKPSTFIKAIPEAKLKGSELPIFFSALLFLAISIMLVSYMPRIDRLYYNYTNKYESYYDDASKVEVLLSNNSSFPLSSVERVEKLEYSQTKAYNSKIFQGTIDLIDDHYISLKCILNNGNENYFSNKETISINCNPNNLLKYDNFSRKFILLGNNSQILKIQIIAEITESCIYISAFLV